MTTGSSGWVFIYIYIYNHISLAPDQIWRHGAKVLLRPGLCDGSVRQQRDHQQGFHVPAGVRHRSTQQPPEVQSSPVGERGPLGNPASIRLFPLPGGSLLAMGQTSDSECTDAPKKAAGAKCLTCSRFCPASATTPTWSPKTAASPAPIRESVSSFVRSSNSSAEPRYPAKPSLMLTLSPFSRRRAVFRQQLQHPAVQEGELQSGGPPPVRGAAAESPEPRGAEAAVTNQRSNRQSGRFMTRTKQYQSHPCLCVHVLGALRGQGSNITLSCTEVQHFKQNHVNYKLAITVKSCHLFNVKTLKARFLFASDCFFPPKQPNELQT